MLKKKWFWLLLLLIVVPVAALLLFLKTPTFGALPSDAQLQSFEQSPQFNRDKGQFENRRSELFEQMRSESSVTDMLSEWFKDQPDRRPSGPLPDLEPDLSLFLEEIDATRVIWFGHSSFLLNISGLTVLVDPVFSKVASPVNFIGKRFQAPALSLVELPPVDVILISHDHYDHLDMNTVKFFADKQALFIAPLGVGLHLERWGVSHNQIVERDWWDSHTVGNVEFIATPAQHFSGRDGINNNLSLWSSWVIKSEESNLFFSGDSGYDTHFQEIGKAFGPFDLAFIEDGQYDVRWPQVHLFPEEAVQAVADLDAARVLPVHWGMFELAYHSWFDPVERLQAALQNTTIELVTPRLGEVIILNDDLITERWWEAVR